MDRRETAEAITRRGLEESVRLLDEQLARATARAEAEGKQRREAERKLAQYASELASLRASAASAQAERSNDESDRLNREVRERGTQQRLESALADRSALETVVQELRTEVEVLSQRLDAEGRARAALSESATLSERELAALTDRVAQQRQVLVNPYLIPI